MDNIIVSNILLWVHLVALVIGGANSVVMPLIGSRLATASPETKGTLFAIAGQLTQFGKGAMAALLITGPLMLWLKWDMNPPNVWFWVKMALIIVMLVTIVLSGINAKKAQQGDMAAARTAGMYGRITALAFVGVILSAALAFS